MSPRRCFLLLSALLLLFGARSFAQVPAVTTTAATSVTDLSATINGTINANGGSDYAYFDYGTTTSYGTQGYGTPFTVNGSSATNVSVNIAGLLPSTTYHFRLKGYSNSSGTYYYGSDLTFTTAAASTPPKITGSASAYSISSTSASVNVSSVFAGSSTATVTFEYGTTATYGSSVAYYTTIPTNGTDYPSVQLSGLTPNTGYHFRCKASNAQGTVYTPDATLTTLANPVFTTGAATAVTDIAATVNGNATSNGQGFSLYMDYGTTTTYGSLISTSPSSVSAGASIAVSANLTALQPNTTYHYRLRAYDSNAGSYIYAGDQSFTTGAASTPPGITGSPSFNSTSTTSTSTSVNNVVAGGAATTVVFEYGTTISYGASVAYFTTIPAGGSTFASASLTGLTPSTTYHCRCKASSALGTAYSPDATFTTLATPVFTTGIATSVTDLSATLNGTAYPNGGSFTLSMEYGATTSYGSNVSTTPYSISGTTPAAVNATPTNLLPNTTYHYRLRAYDSNAGGYLYGGDQTFTTGAPVTPPSITGTPYIYSLGAQSAYVQQYVSSGGSPATVIFEYGTTTAYGNSVSYSTTLATNTSSYASVKLPGLIPGTLYHVRCSATNAQSTTRGVDGTFTTYPAPVLATQAATGVTDVAATLTGTATLSGSGSYNVLFDIGTTASYGSSASALPSSVSGPSTTTITGSPSGLLPSTTYHYRLHCTDGNGYDYYGTDMVFATDQPATLPSIAATGSSSVSASGATLQATNVKSGGSPSNLVFQYGSTTEYGLTASYPSTIPTNTTLSSGTVKLTGLSPSTTYHYRASATNAQGTTYSVDKTFTTLATPTVVTNAATAVTDLAATLNGTANPGGGSISLFFDYGTTASYGQSITGGPSSVSGSSSTNITAQFSGLTPSTLYHYRLRANDGTTNYYGADATFTTAAPATPPTVGNLTAVSTAATSTYLRVSSVAAGSSPATLVFEYGPTATYGTTVTYGNTISIGSTVNNPTVSVTGLTPGTLYHYHCTATNAQGSGSSSDSTFTTPQLPILTTLAATQITDLASTLNGTVNPNGASYSVYFQYGTTLSYGNVAYPSVTSASGTSLLSESAVAASVQPNTTYHYRIIAFDPVGVLYTGSDLTFTTNPAATPPVVGTVTVSASATKASFTVASVFAGSSPAAVSIEYGPTGAYGNNVAYASVISTNTTSAYLGINLTGLPPGTLYHYRCKAVNTEGASYSADATFTTLAAPVITTAPATGVTDVAATFNGTANPSGGSISVSFEYGKTTSYGSTYYPSQFSFSGSATVAVSGAPSGLLPNTTYHYRLRGYDSSSVYFYGADATFTTAPPATPPTVTTGTATAVAATSATLVASSVASGSSATTLVFEYGPTTAYGNQVAYANTLLVNSSYTSLKASVSGLNPGMTYHFRARAANQEGTSYGVDSTFTTLPPPSVTTAAASGVTDVTATLNGTANANGGTYTATYEFGLTTAYGSNATATPSSISGSTSANPTGNPAGILPNTSYHYRLKLSDGVTAYYGADATFTTSAPVTPPAVTTAAATSVSATTATLNATGVFSGSSPAQVVFDYGTTTAYGSTINYVTEMTNRSYSTLSALLTGLQPSTTYHFRIRAANAQGTATGADVSFTTMGIPTLATTAPTAVTDITASLNGTVNPSGVSSTVTFEYGATTAYGSSVSPSAPSVSGTTSVSTSANVTGLQPSQTYHYRLRVDNVDGTYYGADSSFNTNAAGTPPSIGSTYTSTLTATSVQLNVTTIKSGSSAAAVIFEYGLTAAYGVSMPYSALLPASTTGSAAVTLTNLSPATVYHFRARATNTEGAAYSNDATFTTTGLPTVSTLAASGVTDITATVNGVFNPKGTSLSVLFDYGTTSAYGKTSSTSYSSGQTDVPTAATLSGLTPNTVYHYRLRGTDSANAIYSGVDMTFVTGPPTTRPTITTDTAYPQATAASLSATNVTAGAAPATVSWQYGLTTEYTSSAKYAITIPIGQNWGAAIASVSGLTPSTTYHYRAMIADGLNTVYGEDATFTTQAVNLSATTLPATLIRSTSATLNGTYQSNAGTSTLTFEYGVDTGYGTVVTVPMSSNAVSAGLNGLTPAAVYHYRLVNSNSNGTAYGDDMSFTTLATGAPVAITGTATGSATGAAVFRGAVNASGSNTTAVVEYGLSSTYGAATEATPAPVNGNSDTAVTASVTGLTQNATYHYRIVATNSVGTTYGDDATVQMVQAPTVTTQSAVVVSGGAYLQGIINSSTTSTAYFEYGTSTDYGIKVVIPDYYPSYVSIGIGLAAFPQPTPLPPRTTYHFRLVATNAGGTVYGNDVVFTTDYDRPTFAFQPVSGLTGTTATLNATVMETGGTDSVSFSYGTTTDLGTTLDASPSSVSGNGAFPVSLSLTDLNPGTTYHYKLKTLRTYANVTSSLTSADKTFTTPMLLGDWRMRYFGTADSVGIAADDFSLTGDGVPNLLKYALGLDPTLSANGLLPPTTLKAYAGDSYLSYTFSRDPSKTDITYEVVSTDNPAGPWTVVASSVAGAAATGSGFVSETPVANGLISVEVHDTVSTSDASHRYLRLRVTH